MLDILQGFEEIKGVYNSLYDLRFLRFVNRRAHYADG